MLVETNIIATIEKLYQAEQLTVGILKVNRK